MKKTYAGILSLALAIVLVFCLVPMDAQADSLGVCFTAVNDQVLGLNLMPAFLSDGPYVPWTVFGSFGVSADYFQSQGIAMLYSNTIQIMFDMNEGTCYDSGGITYPISAVSLYGTIYVPARTGAIFGLSYSHIPGIGNGDVIRIKNGAEALGDSAFIDAAGEMMKSIYASYYGTADPSPSPSVSPPATSDDPTVDEGEIRLCFAGMPDSELLDLLSEYRVPACFFLTADEADSDGGMVRRIVGEGHSLGIYARNEAEISEARQLIFSQAFFRPFLVTGPDPEALEEAAGEMALALYYPESEIGAEVSDPSVINLRLPIDGSAGDILLHCGDGTAQLISSVLSYMASTGHTAAALREPMV